MYISHEIPGVVDDASLGTIFCKNKVTKKPNSHEERKAALGPRPNPAAGNGLGKILAKSRPPW
jgi:hypothetical protein